MIGIDSLGLRLPDYPFDDVIKNKWHQGIDNIGELSEEEVWRYDFIHPSGVTFYFIYRMKDKAGKPSLFISVSSAARLAFGNNYTAFPDVKSAIEVVEKGLSSNPNIPYIGKLLNVRLYRLDIFCHYRVGIDNLENFLSEIYRADYPQRTRGPYLNSTNENYSASSNNGITFSTPSKKTKTNFYDKYEECLDSATKGYLRHEIQLTNARAIENATGINRLVFKDISESIVEELLNSDLRILRLDSPIVDKHYSEIVLKKKYGVKTGCDLYCLMLFMSCHPTLTKKELALSYGVKSDTLQIKLNKIANAGISPYILEEGIVLPPLSECRSLIA